MLLLLAACSGEPEITEPTGPSGTVTILSGRDEQFAIRLLDLVEQELPGVTVVTDFGKDSGYLDRVSAWGDQPKADLFLSKSSGTMSALSGSGHAATLPPELLERVPERLRGPEGDWVGLSVRARVIVTRKDVEDPPTRVHDLADPRWKGRVARTVATNGSFVGGVATLVAEHGEDDARAFLEALAVNTEGNVHPKHTPAVAAVADGTADVALVNHYYFYRRVLGDEADANADAAALEQLVAEHDLKIVYPDGDGVGTAWNVTGGAVLDGAPNAEAAQAVLGVLLSDAGQQAYAHTNREYPAVEGVASPPGVTGMDAFTWSSTSLAQLADAQLTAVKLIQEVGLD